MTLPHKTAKRKSYGDGSHANMRIVGAYLPRLKSQAKEQPVKLPLKIVYDQFERIMGAQGTDGAWVHLPELVALANAHAATPGPPREDGTYIVRTKSGEFLCTRKTDEPFVTYSLGVFSDTDYVFREGEILCHRKHQPLEVPHGPK